MASAGAAAAADAGAGADAGGGGGGAGKEESCCPPGSVGPAAASAVFVPSGVRKPSFRTSIPLYVVHPQQKTNAGGVLLYPDIYGIESGRTCESADRISRELGVVVIVVDYFRGEPFMTDSWLPKIFSLPSAIMGIRARPWKGVMDAMIEETIQHIREHEGVSGNLATVGFCYGGWVTTHTSALPSHKITCGVGVHPSLQICSLTNDDMQTLLNSLQCPMMMLTAGNDKAEVKPGGVMQKTLERLGIQGNVFKEYRKMEHGWFIRGDIKKPEIAEATESTMVETIDFLRTHLAREL